MISEERRLYIERAENCFKNYKKDLSELESVIDFNLLQELNDSFDEVLSETLYSEASLNDVVSMTTINVSKIEKDLESMVRARKRVLNQDLIDSKELFKAKIKYRANQIRKMHSTHINLKIDKWALNGKERG